jgi:hypothetical protein
LFGLSQFASFLAWHKSILPHITLPILFSCLAHGFKDGVIKCTLDDQKISMSDKTVFECPPDFMIKLMELSVWTCQSGMHVDGSNVDIPPRLHLLNVCASASPVFSEEWR